ncbi:MAG: HesA/MoeB/ThiF family protein [Hydrogenovibrio sp.]
MGLSEAQQSRYSRQIQLTDIGLEGQQRLTQSHAVIFGLGGLGSPAALYLAAAGIGTLTLVDFDQVDDSNLQRQVIHCESRIGQDKVASAKASLQALNHFTEIHTVSEKLSEDAMASLITQADIVLDCTDNFETRYALNRQCRRNRIPLVSAAAIRWEGQLTTYDFRQPNSPCYQCLYKEEQGQELTCRQNGVLAPVVGMIGSMQAIEAIKVLLNLPTLVGKLMIMDARTMQFRTLNLPKDPDCKTCRQ